MSYFQNPQSEQSCWSWLAPAERIWRAGIPKNYIKYTPVAKVIEENGWAVDLFAIEVGAQGYSSRSLSICLKRLGFNNKIVPKTTKSLSCISMKASFYIWLARNSFGWSSNTSLITIEDANFAAAGSKNTNPSRDSRSPNTASVSSKPTRNLRKYDLHTKHPGFFNKGNTCYANSILSFWCQSVRFSITPDQSSDSEYIAFKKTNYSSRSFQLFLGTL